MIPEKMTIDHKNSDDKRYLIIESIKSMELVFAKVFQSEVELLFSRKRKDN